MINGIAKAVISAAVVSVVASTQAVACETDSDTPVIKYDVTITSVEHPDSEPKLMKFDLSGPAGCPINVSSIKLVENTDSEVGTLFAVLSNASSQGVVSHVDIRHRYLLRMKRESGTYLPEIQDFKGSTSVLLKPGENTTVWSASDRGRQLTLQVSASVSEAN